MAAAKPGRTATVTERTAVGARLQNSMLLPPSQLSSVVLQVLFYLSAVYFLFYFLATLGTIIYKSLVLSYPVESIALDVCLLFLLAGLEALRLYWGVRGNLQESEWCMGVSLSLTVPTVLLGVYFLLWQTYVLRADVIISALLLSLYGLGVVLGFVALARFTRSAHSLRQLLNKKMSKPLPFVLASKLICRHLSPVIWPHLCAPRTTRGTQLPRGASRPRGTFTRCPATARVTKSSGDSKWHPDACVQGKTQ
ncbi:transmembrane protein 216 [Arapaima gigas]